MSSLIGIHTLVLHAEADSTKFEDFMTEEAFPTAAEKPGSVNRGGQSSIKSQHLLKSNEESNEYLWLIKFAEFGGVFDRMYEEVREKLETFATRRTSSMLKVVDSLEIGPRDQSGRPTGSPKRGSVI